MGPNIYDLQGFSGHGVAGQAGRFGVFARLKHQNFPGGPMLRTPVLALGMLWHRLATRWGELTGARVPRRQGAAQLKLLAWDGSPLPLYLG